MIPYLAVAALAGCLFLSRSRSTIASSPTSAAPTEKAPTSPVASSPAALSQTPVVVAAAPAPSTPARTAAASPIPTSPAPLTLAQYLGKVADSATPYATIAASPLDVAGGVSTRAYVFRLSAMKAYGLSSGYVPNAATVPASASGAWYRRYVAPASLSKSVTGRKEILAATNAAKAAGWSLTKDASHITFSGKEYGAPDSRYGPWFEWDERRTLAAGQQNLSNITALPPKNSGSPATLQNGTQFTGWVRLAGQGGNYARCFTWTYYEGFLVPTGAKDVPQILYNEAKDNLSDIEQMASFVAAAFTGGAAFAFYGINFVVDETGALSSVAGGTQILQLVEKAATASS